MVPNRVYDNGNERFHPGNIIWDARETNIIVITDKQSGKIGWSVGPDDNTSPERQLRRQFYVSGSLFKTTRS